MRVLVFALMAAVAGAGIAHGESVDERIDAIFEQWDTPGSPGMAVAVSKDGEVVFRKGYGSAQLEYDVPITPETVFHVASVSKQFTAYMTVLLSLDGKLSLDDDIRTFLPELHDFGHTITPRHLIHHTSGLRDQWDLLVLSGAWRMDDVITKDDILYLIERQRELNFVPGDEFTYSNTGFTLLGEICARVSGKTFPELCKERIFEPLGMTNTHFHDNHRHIVPNRAYSYAPLDDGFQNSVLSYANAGATSLFTTVDDLLKWQENFETKQVGGEKGIEILMSTGSFNDGRPNNYGFGLSHGTYKGVPIVNHGGADAGFRSYLVRFPEQRLSVALTANVANVNSGGLAFQVAEIFLGDAIDTGEAEPEAPAETERFVSLDESVLNALEGIYADPRTGEFVRFVESKGVLRLVRLLQETVDLAPLDEETFAPKSGGTLRIRFEGDDAVFYSGERETQRLPRALDRDTSPEYLALLAGTYYSEELDATYRFTVEESGLVMHRVKMAPLVLGTRFRDGFSGDRYSIMFSRNFVGAVDGFRISTGRVRGLRFERVGD